MGMDVDYLAGKRAIDELETLFNDQEHGKRGRLADEIIEFVEKMKMKWKERS